MDEINKIWEKQLKFNEIAIPNFKNLDDKSRQELTKQFVLYINAEIIELLNSVNWKPHRSSSKKINKQNILEELVDIQKFLLGLFQIWGISPEEFVDVFYRKSEVVEQRYKQEKMLDLVNENNVVAIDLDGVLVDYPKCWLDFLSSATGYRFDNLYIAKEKIDPEDYIVLKDDYRNSGIKATLPIVEGALEMVKELKKRGFSIVILSKRPYKQYSRIFSDTLNWLNTREVPYDAIIFDPEKHLRILDEFPKLKFMIEDDRNVANEIAEMGYKVYLLDNIYNQGLTHANVVRIKELGEVLK